MPDVRLRKTEFWRMKEFAKDKMRLEHIAEAIERLQTHAGNLSKAELRKDVLRYYGIVKNIEIIGEAARMLTDEFKSAHPEVQWRNIAGMRNFLVHEYFNVDEETVYEVIHAEIPVLKEQVIGFISTIDWKHWESQPEKYL